MKKILLLSSIVLSLIFGAAVFAQTHFAISDFDINSPSSEINIDKAGKVSIVGAKVMQFAGSTIYTRVIWDNSFVRLIIKTNSATSMTRFFGEDIKLSDVSVGNYISVDGALESGADSLSVIANSLTNLSDRTKQDGFSGIITAIDPSLKNFTFYTKSQGFIKANISTNTSIILGSRTVDAAHLKLGDKIISTTGTFDYTTKTLDAQSMEIYIDTSIFKPRNYSGALKVAPGRDLPTTMVVTIKSTDYLVKLNADTQIINNRRKPLELSRFIVGDSIVFYGAIQENDSPIMDDVEIVRNASL